MKKIITLFFIVICIVVGGCSQFSDSEKCVTEKVISADELALFFPNIRIIAADPFYAEVNPRFAGNWHGYTVRVMDLLGMAPNWNERFDCNRFTLVKLAVIHIRFLVDTWHNKTIAKAPAAGEIFYFINGDLDRGHAILVTIESGQKVYRDIYSEKILHLSELEESTIILAKF